VLDGEASREVNPPQEAADYLLDAAQAEAKGEVNPTARLITHRLRPATTAKSVVTRRRMRKKFYQRLAGSLGQLRRGEI
jgi:hypothetical protein